MTFLRKLFRPQDGDPESEVWLSGEKEYEGFPLLLRRPRDIAFDRLRPKLLVLTHHLAQTKPNGLPEPNYNHTLASFDEDVIRYLPSRKLGRVVLVETFGHRRTYYSYCNESTASEEFRCFLEARYPAVRIDFEEKRDPEAKFIRQYAREHF